MQKLNYSRRLSHQSFRIALALLIGLSGSLNWVASAEPPRPGPAIVLGIPESNPVTEINGIRETRLPNGLTVITKEVHAAPVVFFSVYYRVGSEDEEVGQTGMSHLMEHMMFKGTHKRGPGVISAALQKNGANFNASTWFDRTEYHETLASDRLELAMQIESDRMVNSVFDEVQHQKEMRVVRSEYEAGENDPGQALSKAVRLAAYQVHPYRWETIGFRSDIENFYRDEMYAYYKNFYEPNNAAVVIVGDFSTDKALAMVRNYFGGLPAKPIVTHFITPEPAQEGERRVVIQRAGTSPEVQIAYHIPAFGDPDRYALDVLETVLSAGRTGRFFTALVQTGLVSSAYAYDYGLRDPDLLMVVGDPQPGHTNPEVEQALDAQVETLKTTPISAEELTRVLSESEADYIFSKDSVEAQGRELGEDAMRGDWTHGETYLQHLRLVTPADVQRVAQKYLVERNRTVGYFQPTGEPGGHALHSSSGPAAASPTVAMPHYRAVGYAPDDSGPADERAEESVRAAASSSSLTRPTRVVLDNGLVLVVQENHANPTVSVSGAVMSAGGFFDPPGKRGLAEFAASQLSRGTESRSLMDIARALEGVGASVNVSAGEEYASLRGRALSRDFNLLLDVLSDELQHPSFPQSEIDRARAQELAGIEQERQQTNVLADIAFHNVLFPPGHPYSTPTLDEQAANLKSLTRDDLAAFHDSHYGPDRVILTVVGDVNTDQVIAAVKKSFGGWARNAQLLSPSIPDTPLPAPPAKTTVIFVPDKAQVDVRYGYPGQVKRTDPDFYPVVVLDTILGGGGGLSSRLAVDVRDKLGLVYGIYASDAAEIGAGPFEVEFGSNPANVDKAIDAALQQIALARDKGVTRQEVQDAVSFLTGSYPVALQTNGAVAGQLLIAQVYGLGLDYIQKRNSFYQALTVDQVNAAAKKYLFADRGALIIVGTYTGKYAGH